MSTKVASLSRKKKALLGQIVLVIWLKLYQLLYKCAGKARVIALVRRKGLKLVKTKYNDLEQDQYDTLF